jgi:hypothetical protein
VAITLQSLVAEQCGIATRQQLQMAGLTDDFIRAQIDAGRWRTINESAVSVHNGPLTAMQTRWAAIFSSPPPLALCGLTALECHGITGFATAAVHILVGRGARVLPTDAVDIVVHESRRFTMGDVLPRRPPITTIERATTDAAVWSPDIKSATRVLTAAVQQRRTTAGRLTAELSAAGQVKYRRVLLPFLADLEGGAEALSEVAFLRWCRRHGFPKPAMNVRVDHLGRRRYLDATFRTANDRLLLVEIDGGIHLSLAARWSDTAKDNDAVIADQRTLRFPSVAIYSDDPVAVRQLAHALGLVRRIRGQSTRSA